MIDKVITWCLQNRMMVILSTVFIIIAGVLAMERTPVDAIPDLSDVQVIVYTEYPGQGPQVVEDQVTYPPHHRHAERPLCQGGAGILFLRLLLCLHHLRRRHRSLLGPVQGPEYLNFVAGKLPSGVTPSLGPDATGVGWVYEYVLKDTTGTQDLQQLRSIQDWFLRYELATVPGVSEVASIGGFVKQYQVEVDPNKLLAFNLSHRKGEARIRMSNADVGGRLLEMAEMEFMVRGLGYIQSLHDLEQIALGVDGQGTPIQLKQVADVHLGPELRRGVLEWDGRGEAVGGIAVMRSGENALQVIRNVQKKLKALERGLPPGVVIEAGYNRAELIKSAIHTLRSKLVEELTVVGLICLIFLLHFRSAFVALFTLPVGILMAFIAMKLLGINANIMSLSGIAIAIGVMVDASVVLVENAHKHLARDSGKKIPHGHHSDSAKEVGPALFYSLLIITVSFVPVFSLTEQSGRPLQTAGLHQKHLPWPRPAVLAITIIRCL